MRKFIFPHILLILLMSLTLLQTVGAAPATEGNEKVKVMILDGQTYPPP